MNEPIEKVQIINDATGNPEYAVIPYADYLDLTQADDPDLNVFLPADVVRYNAIDEYSLIKSWRLYKKLSQAEVAERMGVTQPAFQQIENSEHPHEKTLEKVASALGMDVEQLKL